LDLGTPRHELSRRSFIDTVAGALGLSLGATRAAPPDRRRKTILLHSAWDTINIGDIGHSPGTLRIIERHLPDVQVILWTAKLDDRIRAMIRRRMSVSSSPSRQGTTASRCAGQRVSRPPR
jgi:hypothetical protein